MIATSRGSAWSPCSSSAACCSTIRCSSLFNVAADVFGVPVLYAYIFVAWALLIALMALAVETRR